MRKKDVKVHKQLKVSVLLGHLKNISLSVACYDTLSFKMPFIWGLKLYLYSRLKIISYSCRHTGKVFFNSFLLLVLTVTSGNSENVSKTDNRLPCLLKNC